MSIDTYQLKVQGLTVDVVRKDIKNLHLAVYPPTGRVRLAAPLHTTDEAIRLFVISKLSWIRRQREKFLGQARETPRQYVSGETHYYRGRRYRLNVVYRDATPAVVVRNSRWIDLFVRPDSDAGERERVLRHWYRRQLRAEAAPLIAKWEATIGVSVGAWGIRQMKTKWGTCNPRACRIWLNPELIKKPPICLEYVIVHELVHLHERHHNARFEGFMNRYMPLWQHHRAELNQSPIGHTAWNFTPDAD